MSPSPDEQPPRQKAYFPDKASRDAAAANIGKAVRDTFRNPFMAHPEKTLKDWVVFFAPAYFTVVAILVAYALGVLDVFTVASWSVYGLVVLVLALFIQESRPDSFNYFGRNFYHSAGGVLIVMAGLYHVLSFSYVIAFVSILFVAFFSGFVMERLGIETIFSKSHILKHTPTFSKSSHYEAGTYWLLSCLAVLTLFDALTAYAAILILAFGDSSASFVGKTVGRTPNPLNPRKTVEGTLAFFAVSLFATMFIVPTSIAFATAIVVAVVEALPLKINDNLVIPMSAAVTMRLLTMM
jgi:dolichol kinase